VLLAALVGVSIHELVKPLLVGVVLAIALATMVGARQLAQRLMAWGLGLVVAAVVWPAFSRELRHICRMFWTDPHVRLVVFVATGIILAVVVLVVFARAWAAHPKTLPPQRPTARLRVPVTTPEPLPAFGQTGSSPSTADDLDVFMERAA
jgi:hypothetical protein